MQSKFKLLTLVLLSTTFFLTSCGDSTSNPTAPSNQVTDNSTNKPSVPSVNTDSNVTEYSSFPYADIATFFNLTSVTNNQIPSFDIASDESYYGYTSESESSSEFVVYGTIDSSITDSQMKTNYSNALKALGYTVTVKDGYYPYAESEEKGFLLSFGCDNSVFFLDIMKYESTTPDPDTPSTPDTTIKTITIDANNFDAKYHEFESDLTISGYTFKYDYIMNSNGKIQFRNLSKSNSYLFNLTAMNLSTVVLNMDLSKGQYAGIPTLYVSSSLSSASSNGTEISPVITDETTYTYTIPEGNSYFKIAGNQKYASYMNSIAINLK